MAVTISFQIDSQILIMAYDPRRHHRKSVRIPEYDYSRPGAYFVTICTHRRECLFGEVVDGVMRPNGLGSHVQLCWDEIPNHFPRVRLDAFVAMPNHVHGILWIMDDEYDAFVGANDHLPLQHTRSESFPSGHGTSKTIGSIIRGFKIGVTQWTRQQKSGKIVWQRGYHEHVVRNEQSLDRIRKYIRNNPLQWTLDGNHPDIPPVITFPAIP